MRCCCASEGRSSGRCRKRRHLDGDDVEPIIKILAEFPLLDQILQLAIRGGNDAHIGLARLGIAHPLVLALLQKPQQLGLDFLGQFADLIKEQRAAPSAALTLPQVSPIAPVKAPRT